VPLSGSVAIDANHNVVETQMSGHIQR